jgi:5-methylcytosine-specific restriction protein A
VSTGFSPRVVALILQRDGGHCARCDRHVEHGIRGLDWDLHHRMPRGMGGTRNTWVNEAANGVTLCRECHNYVERNRADATDMGWLISRLGRERPTDKAILHARLGYGLLTDDGGFTPTTNPYKDAQ